MKQILFVGGGHDFPRGAFNFLLSLQQQEPVSVMGLFFSPINYEGSASAAYIPMATAYERVTEKERESVSANKALFAKECKKHYIRYAIHENEEQWDKGILAKESRFADLILLSGELFYADADARQPNLFLNEALHEAECPLLIVPEDYSNCNHLFVAYDGSKESLFAMKQFSYLFPHLTDLPMEVVYVKDEVSDGIPDLEHLRHYSRLHYGCMSFSKLHFKAAHYFATWIGERQHVMLITGCYGRPAMSYVMKKSFAEEVINEHKLPVFIAHP